MLSPSAREIVRDRLQQGPVRHLLTRAGPVTSAGLHLSLYRHQRDALAWMRMRERCGPLHCTADASWQLKTTESSISAPSFMLQFQHCNNRTHSRGSPARPPQLLPDPVVRECVARDGKAFWCDKRRVQQGPPLFHEAHGVSPCLSCSAAGLAPHSSPFARLSGWMSSQAGSWASAPGRHRTPAGGSFATSPASGRPSRSSRCCWLLLAFTRSRQRRDLRGSCVYFVALLHAKPS